MSNITFERYLKENENFCKNLFVDEKHTVTEAVGEVEKQKFQWAAHLRELMVQLRQMTDVKPTLVSGEISC